MGSVGSVCILFWAPHWPRGAGETAPRAAFSWSRSAVPQVNPTGKVVGHRQTGVLLGLEEGTVLRARGWRGCGGCREGRALPRRASGWRGGPGVWLWPPLLSDSPAQEGPGSGAAPPEAHAGGLKRQGGQTACDSLALAVVGSPLTAAVGAWRGAERLCVRQAGSLGQGTRALQPGGGCGASGFPGPRCLPPPAWLLLAVPSLLHPADLGLNKDPQEQSVGLAGAFLSSRSRAETGPGG